MNEESLGDVNAQGRKSGVKLKMRTSLPKIRLNSKNDKRTSIFLDGNILVSKEDLSKDENGDYNIYKPRLLVGYIQYYIDWN